ncbi:MAG: methionine--tRNA ligase [Deltaproteobacteria bacterium]|nr:methionine--tRNA ligase [Deltaproteobacteria bacterium]
MKTFYITTPIYYVNDRPHIGHAYCTILADVLKRYHSLSGCETYFLTGVDEHGQKVQEAAKKRGIDPQAHCDEMQGYFRDLWDSLNVRYDRFIRTTSQSHKEVVRKAMATLYEKGEIYRAEYEGWYSPTVEKFFSEEELDDGKCPETGLPVHKLKEENYFFRMGKYRDRLVRHIEENPGFIKPDYRRNEVLGFLRNELKDLCVSRPKSRLAWGIPLPFDENYVTYVWFDALINYVTGAGIYTDEKRFGNLWSGVVHLIGKDILTTHAVYWPTMLFALNIPQPKSIIATGWWLMREAKMSKSLGNVVNPLDLKDKYGVDSLRYFLMREMVIGLDASFSEEAVLRRNNSDLANDLGNLHSRTTKLVAKSFGGIVPERGALYGSDAEIINIAENLPAAIMENVEGLKLHSAIEETMQFVRRLNKYIDETAPFKLMKTDPARAGAVMYNLLEGLRFAAICLSPVMPEKSVRILSDIGYDGEVSFEALKFGALKPGKPVSAGESLFPRYETSPTVGAESLPRLTAESLPRLTAESLPQSVRRKDSPPTVKDSPPTVKDSPPTASDAIPIEDFVKCDIRVGTIKSAEAVAGSKKLIRLQVNLGAEERTVTAGIAEYYKPEELQGKKIVLLANLKPRKIFGIESQGMILAAEKDGKLSLITVDREIPDGAKIS